MVVLLVLVFIGVFIVLTLLLVASGIGASQQTKQTLAVLESALAVEHSQVGDPILDIRKSELLSAVPWVNRLQLEFSAEPPCTEENARSRIQHASFRPNKSDRPETRRPRYELHSKGQPTILHPTSYSASQ